MGEGSTSPSTEAPAGLSAQSTGACCLRRAWKQSCRALGAVSPGLQTQKQRLGPQATKAGGPELGHEPGRAHGPATRSPLLLPSPHRLPPSRPLHPGASPTQSSCKYRGSPALRAPWTLLHRGQPGPLQLPPTQWDVSPTRPHHSTYASPTDPHPKLGLAGGKEEEEATAWESQLRPQGLENKDAPEAQGWRVTPFPQALLDTLVG